MEQLVFLVFSLQSNNTYRKRIVKSTQKVERLPVRIAKLMGKVLVVITDSLQAGEQVVMAGATRLIDE